ncbi:MAG: DNA gyrase subunit A [Chloroflexi bacterium]|nr:DNA gyrase subunit A [Chloroflexota bacterium]
MEAAMTNGLVRQVNIGQEMRDAYLDYAMSVIVARALPDARDGLKPVHRRILYAMYDLGMRSDTPFKKSARIVGEVLGKYHPHGDSSVYEALVRMAQDFSMRYPLIDGQGNFGSVDGDGAAAMRYTEARMTEMGEELLVNINMNTVDFTDNFDGTLQEPSVLPTNIPNLLVNGSSGIAVGMSTNIPPHNLGEVCDALIYVLQHWQTIDDISIQDLMQFVKGPDFPTGGLVYRHADGAEDGEDSLVSAYATGRGKITMRAKLHIEDMGRGKQRVVVSELPFQTNKAALIERIANLVRDGRIEGIADLRDESDRQGLRLAIELQRGADTSAVIQKLFKLTPLQETFSIIMLALVNDEPRVLSLKQALKVYLDHRLEVVRRRSEFELARARERAHILEGLLKALDALDEVIATIRRSRNADTARNNLMTLLRITEIQAQAILDMQLRRLAALERKKIEDEYKEKIDLIKYLEGLLNSPSQMRDVISEEVRTIKSAYGDPRRTIIVDSTAATSVTTESLMLPQEETWVTLTVGDKIARSFETTAPKINADNKEPSRFIVQSDSTQILYLFSTQGFCATIPVHQLPQVNDPAEGGMFADLCGFKNGEEIAALLSLPASSEEGYLTFATRGGEVKRLRLEDLPGMMANVFKAMDIEAEDALGWVSVTNGESEIVLTTFDGQAIRFNESDVRATGLGAGGMRGVKLGSQRDHVVSMGVADDSQHLWTITDDGVAKSSPMTEYPTQGRAGSGVVTMKLPKESQGIAAAYIGALEDRIVVLTSKKHPKTVQLKKAPSGRRDKRGDIVISMNEKEQVVGLIITQTTIEFANGAATSQSDQPTAEPAAKALRANGH